MFKTEERLVAVRGLIEFLEPRMEKVFLVGDYFHNYPSPDIDFYFQNETRIDKAKAITRRFQSAGARGLRQSRLLGARHVARIVA